MPDTPNTDPATAPESPKVQGEGDYVAGRRFQEAERSFVEQGPVERQAREAERALDGPEGDELEAARIRSGKGQTHGEPDGDATDPSAA